MAEVTQDTYRHLVPDDGGNPFFTSPPRPDKAEIPTPLPTDALPLHRVMGEDLPVSGTGLPSYEFAEMPDPVIPNPPQPAWFDKPTDDPRPDQLPQVSRSPWLQPVMSFGQTLSDGGQTFGLGAAEGTAHYGIDILRGGIVAMDAATKGHRKAEEVVIRGQDLDRPEAGSIPTLRSVSEITDPAKRATAFKRLHQSVDQLIDDRASREVAHRLIEDVRDTPEFLDMAEMELNETFLDKPAYQYLTDFKGTVSKTLAPKDGWQDGAVHQVGRGFGSVIGYAATNLIGLGPLTAVPVAMAEGFDDARRQGADPDTAVEAAVIAMFTGLTEKLPFNDLVKYKSLRKGLLGAMENAVRQGGAEAAQETVQQMAFNGIAYYLYRPEKDIFEDLKSAAGVGFAVGGITSLAYGMLGLRRRMYNARMRERLDNHTEPPFEDIGSGKVDENGDPIPPPAPAQPGGKKPRPPLGPAPATRPPPVKKSATGQPNPQQPSQPTPTTGTGGQQLNLPDLDLPYVEGWPDGLTEQE